MNLTISIDDSLLQRARKLAARRGTSVQEVLRGYLETYVGRTSGSAAAEELMQLMQAHGGRSGGRSVRRSEAYEGRA